MRKPFILYSIIGVVVLLVAVLLFLFFNRDSEPIHRAGDNDKKVTDSSSKTSTDSLKEDLDKYREDETVSNAKTDRKKASEQAINLNADNKVLVETDSNNAEAIKESMIKWNSALGENVFLPAKKNGRTDLLIQDDETQIPVNIYSQAGEDEDIPSEYKKLAVSTQDHRIMLLDNINTRLSDEFDYSMEDEINRVLGHSIGIEEDVKTIKDNLSSEEGRESLKDKFEETKKKGLYNEGLTYKTVEAETMGSAYNKTYATWTNYRDSIENLPRFKGHNKELLKIIDSESYVLYGEEAVEQGKKIDEELKSILKDKDNESDSNSGKYRDDEKQHDGTLTIANSSSTMGKDEDFINLTKDYNGE